MNSDTGRCAESSVTFVGVCATHTTQRKRRWAEETTVEMSASAYAREYLGGGKLLPSCYYFSVPQFPCVLCYIEDSDG